MSDFDYSQNLNLLYEAFSNGLAMSRKLSGQPSNNAREGIGSILFAKSVAPGSCLLKLLPRSRLAISHNNFWDISSVASLTRNLKETSNSFAM
jgi:hypothetical protein